MAYTVKELAMAYTMKEFAKLRISDNKIADCHYCGRCIRESHSKIKGPEYIWHTDCYYDDLSDLLDKYPIGFVSYNKEI